MDTHTNTTRSIRDAAVADSFYPANPGKLRALVSQLLQPYNHQLRTQSKAIIAPHAGYIYSGDTAAKVYADLRNYAENIRRVVLLGPVHRVYTAGIALSSATHFATPLGNVPIDRSWQARIEGMDGVQYHDAAHLYEHSLEVHLPFLQMVLPHFTLVPIAVGDASGEQVATVLEQLWGGHETLLVVSSDLSHYHDYETAKRIDTATCRSILACDDSSIHSEQACGCRPLAGLLRIAKMRQMHLELIDLCNSGDTAGDQQRVVGYCAVALKESLAATATREDASESLIPDLTTECIQLLFTLAWQGIRKDTNSLVNRHLPVVLQQPTAVFVTIKKNNQLRGCIGHTKARLPLAQAVLELAQAAAHQDPRFPSVCEEEYPELHLELSLLGPEQELHFANEAELLTKLRPGIDGLSISYQEKHATFLPAVWKSLPDTKDFLHALKQKAGISAQQCPQQAWIYQTKSYEENSYK